MDTTHTLILPSTFQSVEKAVDDASTFFTQWYDDDDILYTLQLLASEAVTNGIEHGNSYDESKSVTVVYTASHVRATISVEDQGSGFVRKDVADPMDASNLMEDGGRGLFLMESMSDEVRYDLDGRRITIVINIPSSGE